MYRHGDVLLIRRGNLQAHPNGEEETEIVVAEGEVTGHAHRVRGAGASYDLPSLLDIVIDSTPTIGLLDRVLMLPVGGTIRHEEHRTIDLPPGIYEVRHQRTMTSPGQWQRVQD